MIGTFKGAEAALLLASRDDRIRAVAALSPSAVIWANLGPCAHETAVHGRSSWSADGQPLPFVPYKSPDESFSPRAVTTRFGPPTSSLQISDRRSAHQLATDVITARAAGQRLLLPGEPINPPGGMAMARGGTPAVGATLGQRVWPALLRLLRLPTVDPDTSVKPGPA